MVTNMTAMTGIIEEEGGIIDKACPQHDIFDTLCRKIDARVARGDQSGGHISVVTPQGSPVSLAKATAYDV
jgi:hypothetical protein